MIQFIDDHTDEFGVEPVCRHLPIAPQTYYASKTRAPSRRSITDEALTMRLHEIHGSNYGVYGVRKVHTELLREGRRVARYFDPAGSRPRTTASVTPSARSPGAG